MVSMAITPISCIVKPKRDEIVKYGMPLCELFIILPHGFKIKLHSQKN